MKKMNVESFNLRSYESEGTLRPFSRCERRENGDKIYKYDIRFCQPNKEHMEMPALHSLEHLMAEKIRNHHRP